MVSGLLAFYTAMSGLKANVLPIGLRNDQLVKNQRIKATQSVYQ